LLLIILLTLFLSERGFSFLSAGVVALLSPPEEPVAAAAAVLAVEPAAVLLAEEADLPSTLDDCTHTHTHREEHKAHMQEGKKRGERVVIARLLKHAPIDRASW
jgi:hypothetical protein